MNATITSVGEPRDWTTPDGSRTLSFIDVVLEGKGKATYTAKPNTAAGHVERFKALIGKPAELALEESEKGLRIKDYPGKPTAPGSGGGGRPESWGYSEAGSRFRENASHRRTALMTAKDLSLGGWEGRTADVIFWAETFYEWLSKPPADATSVSSDTAGTQAGRDEAHSVVAVAEPSRPATTSLKPWNRYVAALEALQGHLKLDSLAKVRTAYVKPFCSTHSWDYPPTAGWPADVLEAIAVMLERRLAVEAHSTAESA